MYLYKYTYISSRELTPCFLMQNLATPLEYNHELLREQIKNNSILCRICSRYISNTLGELNKT